MQDFPPELPAVVGAATGALASNADAQTLKLKICGFLRDFLIAAPFGIFVGPVLGEQVGGDPIKKAAVMFFTGLIGFVGVVGVLQIIKSTNFHALLSQYLPSWFPPPTPSAPTPSTQKEG